MIISETCSGGLVYKTIKTWPLGRYKYITKLHKCGFCEDTYTVWAAKLPDKDILPQYCFCTKRTD